VGLFAVNWAVAVSLSIASLIDTSQPAWTEKLTFQAVVQFTHLATHLIMM